MFFRLCAAGIDTLSARRDEGREESATGGVIRPALEAAMKPTPPATPMMSCD
jgi:hypothetical protein